MTAGMLILIIVVGVPIFLLMEHPVISWIIFLPLVVIGIVKFITWLRR